VKSISQLKRVSVYKAWKDDLLGCTKLISPNAVMGLHERSRTFSASSFGLAASTKHSEAVKNVEFSWSSTICAGQHEIT
jgi:hypothetical protein